MSEEDKRRQRAREKELEEAGNLFDNKEEEEGEVGGQMGRSEARGKRRKEPAGGRRRDGEHDAQKIYREILEVKRGSVQIIAGEIFSKPPQRFESHLNPSVVKKNSPASMSFPSTLMMMI